MTDTTLRRHRRTTQTGDKQPTRAIASAADATAASLAQFKQLSAGHPVVTWFDVAPEQLPRARKYAIAQLHAHGADTATLSAAELLVSELFTNVIRHTQSRQVGVSASVTGLEFTVSISEECRSVPTQFVTAVDEPIDDHATRGRGLGILDWLAESWGMTRRQRITTTWFQLVADRPPHRRSPADSNALADVLSASERRTDMLAKLTEDLAHSITPNQVADAVTRHLRGHVNALFASLALVDRGGRTMTYLSLDPLPADTAARWHTFALDRTAPCGAAALDKTPHFHQTPADAERDFPGITEHMKTAGTEALAHLPLTAAGITFGTLGLAWQHPTTLPPEQRALLLIVAGYCAQALAHAKLVPDETAFHRRLVRALRPEERRLR